MELSGLKRYFVFKYPDRDAEMLALVHPYILMVLADISLYSARQHYPPLIITRSIDEKIDGMSISTTHEEGRALDISVRNLLPEQISDLVNYCNKSNYAHMGAIGYSTGLPRLCVFHGHEVGGVPHMHIQISKEAAII